MNFQQELPSGEHINLNNVKTLCDRLCMGLMLSKFWPLDIYIEFVLPLRMKSLWFIIYCQAQYTWLQNSSFILYLGECLRKVSLCKAVYFLDRFYVI